MARYKEQASTERVARYKTKDKKRRLFAPCLEVRLWGLPGLFRVEELVFSRLAVAQVVSLAAQVVPLVAQVVCVAAQVLPLAQVLQGRLV